ncbi:methylthioribose kinase [Aquibacillus halophilus]|uniref:Methylthioribose kinase n=1 Tax=Aquibacillus halophilus TaxID=930132 RepID=A0A6A8D969_9BACI|nr:methylthioribose kinase [Aquibacillus halophilus]MRH42144.1 methylthioribose kinase [Aquibacillus halophilus]
MIQRFIELGDGYSDVYELVDLANYMKTRIEKIIAIHTNKNGQELTSLAIIMKPGAEGDFQPIYICFEGVPNPANKVTKRYQLFEQIANQTNQQIREITVKPSTFFHDKSLYYQYLLGIFRMNRFLKPYQ